MAKIRRALFARRDAETATVADARDQRAAARDPECAADRGERPTARRSEAPSRPLSEHRLDVTGHPQLGTRLGLEPIALVEQDVAVGRL